MELHKEIKERIDNLELTYVAVENPLAKIKELEERIKNLTDSVHELERFVHTRTRN
jgi:predicted RNA-binding protein with EMAP domain